LTETSTPREHAGDAESSATPAAGDGAHGHATLRGVFAVLCYQGYALAILGVGAPFIGKSFALDQAGIARMYAWISLNSLGALILSRMADRIGRRRIVMLSLVVTPLCSLGAALSARVEVFVIFEILVYAAIGATFGACFVMVAEALPIDQRSKGQGWANLATGIGGGVCVILAPLLAHFGLSWRWLLALPSAGIVLVPAIGRMLPESERWARASVSGVTGRSRFYDVFGPAYRRRTIPLMAATLLGEASGVAVATWIYYHAVSVVGLSPGQGAAILLIGGTLSTAGLALGVWMSEFIGRVRSIVILGLAGMIGVLAYYWGPPTGFVWPMLWLLLAHTWFATTGRGLIVAANSAVTELFPTALRGAIMGWLTLCVAVSAIAAQVTIAVLARRAGLSIVVGWIALLTIPCVIIWGLYIDETRGLTLEAAAREQPEAL
jgi:putative MFS transporter